MRYRRWSTLLSWSERNNHKVTLDWDIESEEIIKRRVAFIRKDFPGAVIRIRQSALKGYHVIVVLPFRVDQFYYRRRWRDDGNRLVLDILRGVGDDKEPMQILWDKKMYRYKKDGTLITWPAGEWKKC